MTIIIAIACALMATGIHVWQVRKLRGAVAAAVGVAEQAKAALDAATELIAKKTAELDLSAEAALVHKRRADEFFALIQGIERERDIWQKFFFDSARKSGVAQNWLLRDLSGAVQRANAFAAELRKLGKPAQNVSVHPQLKEIIEDYGAEYPDGKADAVATAPGFARAKEIDQELTGAE